MKTKPPALLTRTLVLLALMVAPGCTATPAAPPAAQTSAGGTTTAPAAAPLGTVTVRMEGDWAHFNVLQPKTAIGTQAQAIALQLYDSLVSFAPDPKDPSKVVLVPYLATSWEQTPTRIVFKIRNDATCSDGTKVTPSLIKQTADVRVKGSGVPQTFGRGPFTTIADDATGTFTFDFGQPYSDGIYGFLSYQGLPIVCPAGLANPDMLENAAAGSGPYVLESAVHGDQAVLKRRDDWSWGPNGITAKDLPERVIMKVIPNDTTAANLLTTSGLDMAKIGNGPDVTRLLTEKSLVNKTVTSAYNYPLIFNQKEGRPTADIKVREALAAAIDPKAWNQAANQGRGEISTSFVQPKADCFDPSTADLAVKDPSPEKAKQILVDAGWTLDGSGKLVKNGQPLRVILTSMVYPGIGAGGEFVATKWQEAGVTVDLQMLDFNTFLQRQQAADFDAGTVPWGVETLHPAVSAGFFTGNPPPNGTNRAFAVNPTVEAAIVAAQANVGAERCKQWSIVQRSFLETHTVVPMAAPQVQWFTRGIDMFPAVSAPDMRFVRRAK